MNATSASGQGSRPLIQANAPVLANDQLAERIYSIRLHCPELARSIRPGQFLMVRLPDTTDPLLGRPFALYDTVLDDRGQPVAIDVAYLVVGKVTNLLASLNPGASVEVWGPLGNGFTLPQKVDHVGLVAGGIGQTPFLAHVRELLGGRGYGGNVPSRHARRVTLYYGVRTAALAAGVEDFQRAGATVLMATDDGSLGFHGLVTDLLEKQELPQLLVGCGPEPMLKSLAALAQRRQVPCHVSLETPMACGIGICFSCVTRVKVDQGWDYRRVCLDGPVFEASALEWE